MVPLKAAPGVTVRVPEVRGVRVAVPAVPVRVPVVVRVPLGSVPGVDEERAVVAVRAVDALVAVPVSRPVVTALLVPVDSWWVLPALLVGLDDNKKRTNNRATDKTTAL